MSFYNESETSAIDPTVVVGMLGLLEDYRLRVSSAFPRPGLALYLLGETFSAADAYLFAVLRWTDRVELPLPEPLQRFMARMRQRPAVAEALRVEGLT